MSLPTSLSQEFITTALPRVPEPDGLLTVQEVAEILRVPVSWVYERTRRRGNEQLPHIKLGKYLRFRRTDVLGWLNAHRI
jgi:excisionase family DNA binding protein